MKTPIPTVLTVGLLLAVSLRPAAAGSSEPGLESVTDAVTASNLLGHERYWPYRVTLVEAWQPEGRETPLRAGSSGILIRVDSAQRARIDFGSAGKYEVPVDRTDLVAAAERVRSGETPKSTPNFTLAIGAHLLDSSGRALTGLRPEVSADRPGFLCVFADPGAGDFDAMVAALRPLRDRNGVMTILFPQGAHPDARMRERLQALQWTVPFSFDFLSEPYTSTLLADGAPMPLVLLQTNEGRVVFQRAWEPDIVPELTAAIDGVFGDEKPEVATAPTRD